MPVAAIGAIATVGAAALSAKAASDQADAAERASAGQNKLANTQADIALEQWNQYKEIYAPLEKQFTQEAFQGGITPETQRAMGLLKRSYGDAQAQGLQMVGAKNAYGGGYEQNMKRELGLREAGDMARLLADTNTENWNRKLQAISLGKGLPTSAMSGLQGAAGSLGQIASMRSGWAQAGMQGAGSAIGNLGMMAMMNPGMFSMGGGAAGASALPGPLNPTMTAGLLGGL